MALLSKAGRSGSILCHGLCLRVRDHHGKRPASQAALVLVEGARCNLNSYVGWDPAMYYLHHSLDHSAIATARS
jgi:hypothetical protein